MPFIDDFRGPFFGPNGVINEEDLKRLELAVLKRARGNQFTIGMRILCFCKECRGGVSLRDWK